MSIQARLKAVRKETGKNQIPFAEQLGVSQSAYANYERGATDIPISLAVRICTDFKVSAAWLLLGRGEMHDEQLGPIVEDAVMALQNFIQKNDLRIPAQKQAKLARFLAEEMLQGNEFDGASKDRFFRAAV